jgi:hypothetical protein
LSIVSRAAWKTFPSGDAFSGSTNDYQPDKNRSDSPRED